MADEKKKKKKGGDLLAGTGGRPGQQQVNTTGKAVYIGVDVGSDLETYGYQTAPRVIPADPYAISGPAQYSRTAPGKRVSPRYQVGYINSDKFAQEMDGLNKETVERYQKYMYDGGLLKNFTPGRLDKPTRNAFKELMASANQNGTRWQDELYGTLERGVIGPGERERAPFLASPDDPVTLRDTFRRSVQEIYGGDLPDAEVNAMVDAFRSQQIAAQQARYNEGDDAYASAGASPVAYAMEEVKAKHPQQLDRVKFADTFSSIMDTFKGGAQ